MTLSSAFGGHSIGSRGSICLLYNALTGAGLVLYPTLLQQTGWLIVSTVSIGVALITLIAAALLLEAVARVPGNARFHKRVELSTACKYWIGNGFGSVMAQSAVQLSFLTANITTIVQSVQVVDWAISDIFGSTCAVSLWPMNATCTHSGEHGGGATPFDAGLLSYTTISMGLLLTAILCIPLGIINLDENIVIQEISALWVILITIVWAALFANQGLQSSRISVVGSDGFANVLGVIVFNFAVITTLPSWVSEKAPNVSVRRSLFVSMLATLFTFMTIGILGGLAFEPWYKNEPENTILDKVRDIGSPLATFSFFFFPIVVNVTAIPVYSIMMRYNIIEENLLGAHAATFVSVLLPWILAIPLYSGTGFAQLINFAGLAINSIVSFVLPSLLFLRALDGDGNSVVISDMLASELGVKPNHDISIASNTRAFLHDVDEVRSIFFESANVEDRAKALQPWTMFPASMQKKTKRRVAISVMVIMPLLSILSLIGALYGT